MVTPMARRWALVLFAIACSSTPEKATTGEAKTPEGPKELEHQKCDKSMGRVEALDTDHDNKPELLAVFNSNNKELCRAVDFNHDGKPDFYEYYNEDGTLRRREGAYEKGVEVISEIQYFEGGKLVRRERDTLGLHKIDTWDTYDPATGKLVKRERATKGDGKVDQWWTWEGDHINIEVDKNGSGHPDPTATIQVALNGDPYVSPQKKEQQAASGDAGAGPNIPPPPNPPVLMPSSMPMDQGKKTGKTKPK
jgi:hypothetical protein